MIPIALQTTHSVKAPHLFCSRQGLPHRLASFLLFIRCADEASELLPGGLNVLGAWTHIAQQDDPQPAAERISQLTHKELAARNTVPYCNMVIPGCTFCLTWSSERRYAAFDSRRHQCLQRPSRQRL